jgi:hypothetical protein
MKTFFDTTAFKFLISFFVLCFFSSQGIGQTVSKKTDHADARLEADAAGLAYIQCKYDVLKYNSETKENNSQLLNELKDVTLIYRQFSMSIDAKYEKDPELFEKFKHKVTSMKKQLKTCKKYQNILDANERMEKMQKKN